MVVSPIINLKELFEIYQNQDVMIFDVRNSKNAKSEYQNEHLEGAFFVDLNTELSEINSDISINGRHPLPKLENFSKFLSRNGISKEKHIVLYDTQFGANAAARFWWMLKAVGFKKVQVLNGGFSYAKANNFPINSKIKISNFDDTVIDVMEWELPTVDISEIEKIIYNPNYLIVDVRSKDRYDGLFEPLDSIAGHIPGAVNVPFLENLDDENLFLSPSEIKAKYIKLFNNYNSKNIIIHCGSGVTACHTLLCLEYANLDLPNLYVGSWSEWSRKCSDKIETNL